MTPARNILDEINAVFRAVFANSSLTVTESTTAADIPEWDSLNHTMLIAAVEKHFGVKFSIKEVMRFRNVGDMCKVVAAKLGA
jgi:acyl carrier protein